jgi:hypothetical protein
MKRFTLLVTAKHGQSLVLVITLRESNEPRLLVRRGLGWVLLSLRLFCRSEPSITMYISSKSIITKSLWRTVTLIKERIVALFARAQHFHRD